MDFKGKNIMVFAPYGCTQHYGDAIRDELISRGANVKRYDERPSQKSLTKIVIRLFKKKIPQIFDRYIAKLIRENEGTKFDYILICKGEAFTPLTINHLRNAYPGVKIILYLWDVMHLTKMDDVIASCDRVYSFDPGDVAKNKGLIFRPTFFVKEYKEVRDTKDYNNDVVFIGTLFGKRYKEILNFKNKFEAAGYRFLSYLYVPGLIVYIKDFITKFPYISFKKIHLDPLSVAGTVDVLNETKAILDINYSFQQSLSTRAHEAMAARRKYITTNPEIKTYDYYNPNNIMVIDRQNPVVPKEFIESEFEPISDEILYKYSIPGLVDDLFNDNLPSPGYERFLTDYSSFI
jgi:hypothetical protein